MDEREASGLADDDVRPLDKHDRDEELRVARDLQVGTLLFSLQVIEARKNKVMHVQ